MPDPDLKPNSDKDAVATPRLTRLHVNLNRATADALREAAERRDVTITDAVRQAVGTWSWFEDAVNRGARIQIVEPDGQTKEVIPIF